MEDGINIAGKLKKGNFTNTQMSWKDGNIAGLF